jgi:hypothetical protein
LASQHGVCTVATWIEDSQQAKPEIRNTKVEGGRKFHMMAPKVKYDESEESVCLDKLYICITGAKRVQKPWALVVLKPHGTAGAHTQRTVTRHTQNRGYRGVVVVVISIRRTRLL